LIAELPQYLDYAQGYNLTNRMPLFVYPKTKLTLTKAMDVMRTHFEGSWCAAVLQSSFLQLLTLAVHHRFDTTGTQRADVGAGPGIQQGSCCRFLR